LDIKKYFHDKLISIYPSGEISSIFKILIESKFGLKQKDLILNPDIRLSESEVLQLQFALKRLLNNEPIQYILGETEFMGLRFEVNPNVLIPRPETEELVSWVLDELPKEKFVKIIDACTGSGCIAISLKKFRLNAEVKGFDISKNTLETALKNSKNHNLEIDFFEFNALKGNLNETANILVSNPPYVSNSEAAEMRENVLSFEPHMALFPEDDDVLIFYKKILKLAMESKIGLVYFEINQYKKKELSNWLSEEAILKFEFKKDMSENYRFLKITL